jgi:hypothetical protein
MANVEEVLSQIIARINRIERELDDLKSQAGETTSLDVSSTLPGNPYPGQVVLLTDGTGANGNGTFFRFDDGAGSWAEVV